MRQLGDLPFYFDFGACGTFMINDLPTVLLCFNYLNGRRCRSLIRKNEIALRSINNFALPDEFELDTVDIPNSKYYHSYTKMANYHGYPLILGGAGRLWANEMRGLRNAKLEMLVTTELPIQWNEQTDYPYADM